MWRDVSELRLMISQADPGVFQVFTDSTFPSKLPVKVGCCCQKSTHTPLSHLRWWITRMREATLGCLGLCIWTVHTCRTAAHIWVGLRHAGTKLCQLFRSGVTECLVCKTGVIYLHLTAIFGFLHFTMFQHHNLAAACSEAIDTSIVVNIPTGLQLSIFYRFQLLQFNCLIVFVLSLHSTWEIGCYLVYRDTKKAWGCVNVLAAPNWNISSAVGSSDIIVGHKRLLVALLRRRVASRQSDGFDQECPDPVLGRWDPWRKRCWPGQTGPSLEPSD